MLQTRMTSLFGVKYPIMMAGMNIITEPGLVSAVSNAGGLGVLATGHLTPDEARKNIRDIRRLTSQPFGLNQSLARPGAQEKIAIAIEEKVPIINYSLGKPWFIDEVHKYGGKVLGTIATVRHAVRAEQLGVDAIVITGHEAAAHGGYATSLVLLTLISSQVKVPLIAAGGFYDGRGLAAALLLGADAISMGTRFVLTKESIVHEHFKEMLLKSTEQDTFYSDAFDGMPSRVLKTKATEVLMKRGFRPLEALTSAMKVKRMLNLPLFQFIGLSFSMMKGEEKLNIIQQARYASHAIREHKAIYDGSMEEGVLPTGQIIGGIRDLPTCRELLERIVIQAEETLKRSAQLISPAV